jgi:hypothetical protein
MGMPAVGKATRAKGGPAKTGSARRHAPGAPLAGALAEAAWAEADEALAQALADLDELESASDQATRDDVLAALSQSLMRAARRRGLTRVGVVGEREAYDPERHELLVTGAKRPKIVCIRARGVARGAELLVKPRAGPSERRS